MLDGHQIKKRAPQGDPDLQTLVEDLNAILALPPAEVNNKVFSEEVKKQAQADIDAAARKRLQELGLAPATVDSFIKTLFGAS